MKGFRVLVIDDETAILRMLAMALSKKGYQVDTAESGNEGIWDRGFNSQPFTG